MLVLGDGEQRGSLEALSRELHVDDRVIFFGHVAQNKVQSILSQTDVFLSLYDLSNIGNPLFEAMNAGVPVLTVDVGATGTVIRDGENIITGSRCLCVELDAETVSAVAGAVIGMLPVIKQCVYRIIGILHGYGADITRPLRIEDIHGDIQRVHFVVAVVEIVV